MHLASPHPSPHLPETKELLICRSGWSPTGGAEKFLLRFADGLERSGLRAVLVTDSRWPRQSWPGENLERIGGGDLTREIARIRRDHPGGLLFSMDRLPGADVFRAGDGLHSAWLRRLEDEEGRWKGWFRRNRPMHRRLLRLERRLFQSPGLRIIANSRMVADEITRAHVIDPARIAVIPNGYDAPELDEAEKAERRRRTRRHFDIPEGATVFLFVGTGWKRKGAAVLTQAFRRLDDENAYLILTGKGAAPFTDHPRIRLAGPVGDPTDHYLAADVFVLPTLYDPFSNACLEAAAHGLPVITSDANGFREVIASHPEAGEIVPVPRTAAAWAEALGRWMDPQRRERALLQLARIKAHHTIARNVSATIDFLFNPRENP